jgi:type IV pilus assembly protein PilV
MSVSETAGRAALGGRQNGCCRHRPLAGNAEQAGLTLIEVLVALVVVSIGLLAIAGMQATAVGANRDARMRTEATALAARTLERLRLLPFDHPDLAAGATPHRRSPQRSSAYTLQWTVKDGWPAAGTKTVWVHVSWQGAGKAKTVRLRTVVADRLP